MQSAAIMDGKPSKGIIAVSPAATDSFENARDGLEMQDGDVIETRHGAHFKSSCVSDSLSSVLLYLILPSLTQHYHWQKQE